MYFLSTFVPDINDGYENNCSHDNVFPSAFMF